ncbi:MAG: hypothetical protein ACK4SX_01720 [Alcanivoracaceae bacterium]
MKRLLAVLTTLISGTANAHSIPVEIGQPVIDAALAVTVRSAGAVDYDDYWRIPGVMMGGHAWPAEQGVALEELTLSAGYRHDDNLFAVISLARHGSHGDHAAPEIEHGWIGYVCCGDTGPLVIEAGRMSAAFTPSASEHSSQRLFVDANLAADAFLGRHFHDEGLRLWRHEPKGVSAGVELWRGRAFPATADEDGGAVDLFASWHTGGEHVSLTIGGWAMFARAAQRQDHRYSDGHSHGSPGNPPPPDVRFSGDSLLHGLHGEGGWHTGQQTTLRLRIEWMAVRADGTISDATRQAELQGRYQGIVLQPELQHRKHAIAVRAETLILENRLSGAAALPLAEDANLINNRDPWRFGVGWRWQWREPLAIRAEILRDASTPEASTRVALGLVWKQTLTGRHRH